MGVIIEKFNQEHLKKLQTIAEHAPVQGPVGESSQQWMKKLFPSGNFEALSNIEHTRESLRKFCQEKSNRIFDCVVAICAWGGMTARNGRIFLKDGKIDKDVARVLEDLRKN